MAVFEGVAPQGPEVGVARAAAAEEAHAAVPLVGAHQSLAGERCRVTLRTGEGPRRVYLQVVLRGGTEVSACVWGAEG